MTKKWMAALLGAAAMALSSVAAAQMPALYVGGEVGSSEVGSETDTMIKALVGFQFHPNVAAEVGYGFLYDKGATEVTALEIVAVGMFPVAPQISLLGKVGFASVEVDTGFGSDDKVELLFGIGAQYDVTRNLGARLLFTRYNTDDAVDVISIGVVWRF